MGWGEEKVGCRLSAICEMVRTRVYGILADYAEQNDHDVRRSDPIVKLDCRRSIHSWDLASEPTLARKR